MKKLNNLKDVLRDLRFTLDTYPANIVPRNKGSTELMMKEFVARADRGEEMPSEAFYFVEPFRAYLSGKMIETALHLNKTEKKFTSKYKQMRDRKFQAAALYMYHKECEKLKQREINEIAKERGLGDSDIQKTWRKYRHEVELFYNSYSDPRALTNMEYCEYLRALANQQLSRMDTIRNLVSIRHGREPKEKV